MDSIALVFSGAMQSWGDTSFGSTRRTLPRPTKSGVIGIIANALGRDHEDDISDLAGLDFGVRVDSPGTTIRDFHTVTITTQVLKGDTTDRITERFYVADGVFVVVLASQDAAFLDVIERAVKKPARAIYLGRKSCTPDRPIFLSRQLGGVKENLASLPWQGNTQDKVGVVTLDIYRSPENEDEAAMSKIVMEEPVSFSKSNKKHASRAVFHEKVVLQVNEDGGANSAPTIPLYMQKAVAMGGAV